MPRAPEVPAQPEAPVRSTRSARRDELLDAAARLLEQGGLNAVTMDAVAGAAGVSRPLVYKHFANREELVADLWRRDTAEMDRAVGAALAGVDDFEAIVRISVETILDVTERRGRNVASLIRGEVFEQAVRDEQRARHRRTRAWYTGKIRAEFGLDQADAEVAIAVFFAGLDAMLADFRSTPVRADRARTVDVYVALVMGGLRSLRQAAGDRGADPAAPDVTRT